MSLQDDFTAGAQEYARRLEKQREADRLAGLKLEARQHGNAAAFAEFFEERLTQHETEHDNHSSTDTQEN